jgi:quercetin dioxygenase-like cupin family protein
MTTTEDPSIQPLLNTRDETAPRWFLGTQVWPRAASAETGTRLGVIEQIVPPGLGSPYHVHRHEDEAFYVLEGEIRFFSDGGSQVLGPGGLVFLPRGMAHGYRTEGDVPSRSLVVSAPAGFESFVAEMSTAEPPDGPPDMDALMAAAGRYGIVILGPLPE